MRYFVFLISVMLIIIGCKQQNNVVAPIHSALINEGASPATTARSEITNDSIFTISYIDDSQYKDPLQKQLIKIINENTKALNDRDRTAFLASFTSNTSDNLHLENLYKYMVDTEKEFIIKMENIEFAPNFQGNGEYAVTLIMTLYYEDSKETKKQSSTYYFKEINNKWQLFAID